MKTRVSPIKAVFLIVTLMAATYTSSKAVESRRSLEDNFSIMRSDDHFIKFQDGQSLYSSLDEDTVCGFLIQQKHRFGWFNMKLKLVGVDSPGVFGAYYACTENQTGPTRDELGFEFLGNGIGQLHWIQTNVYKDGSSGHEIRHMLWFDPSEKFHTYSILWNSHQIVFFVDRVPMRVHNNNGEVTEVACKISTVETSYWKVSNGEVIRVYSNRKIMWEF